MAYVLAEPQSKLNFSHDWSPYLATGDSIASHQWTVRPLDEASPAAPLLSQETSDMVWIEGMTVGEIYHLTERVVTANGVRDERTVAIRCEQQ